MDPLTLKYGRSHEWIHVEGQVATIGISDFAVKALTDLVYVELPHPGDELTAGETFGEVESVKAVSDLYAPVSGTVVEVNETLADDLDALSEDPYGRGWMLKVRISDEANLQQLLDRTAYDEHCQSEDH